MAWADTMTTLAPTTWFKLNEASGNFADSGSAALTGVANGTITYAQAGLVYNDADTCITLDGATEWIEAGDNYDAAGTASISIMVLVNVTVPPASNDNFTVKFDGTSGWTTRLDSAGTVSMFRLTAAGNEQADGPFVITSGARYMLLFVYNGATMTVYINGRPGTAVASSRSLPGHATVWTIGRLGASGNYVTGSMDEVAVWDARALNGAEALWLAQEGGYAPPRQHHVSFPHGHPGRNARLRRHRLVSTISQGADQVRQGRNDLLTSPLFNLTPGGVYMPALHHAAWTLRPPVGNRGMHDQIQNLQYRRDLYLPAGSGDLDEMLPAGSGDYTGPNTS